jgi:tRNA pseudouridine55 synthase
MTPPPMAKNKSLSQFPPLVFNIFKPAKMTSYDVIRHFKRNLPIGFGKIGHFGTLDPFASGVLMIGIGGAARLNDYIHEFLPKTYLAVGKLGIETPTGDYESEISQRDDSVYLKREIASFSAEFIEERLRDKFLGEYWQAPHKYSASKFMGRNMHEWAREGIEVKKEPVLRHVYDIQVVKYKFPYLSVRVTVSSGTQNALKMKNWPKDRELGIIEKGIRVDDLLPFDRALLDDQQSLAFKNGAFLKPNTLDITKRNFSEEYIWMTDEKNNLLGLAQKSLPTEIRPKINFHLEALNES